MQDKTLVVEYVYLEKHCGVITTKYVIHPLHTEEVTGSNPVLPTKKYQGFTQMSVGLFLCFDAIFDAIRIFILRKFKQQSVFHLAHF